MAPPPGQRSRERVSTAQETANSDVDGELIDLLDKMAGTEETPELPLSRIVTITPAIRYVNHKITFRLLLVFN